MGAVMAVTQSTVQTTIGEGQEKSNCRSKERAQGKGSRKHGSQRKKFASGRRGHLIWALKGLGFGIRFRRALLEEGVACEKAWKGEAEAEAVQFGQD